MSELVTILLIVFLLPPSLLLAPMFESMCSSDVQYRFEHPWEFPQESSEK